MACYFLVSWYKDSLQSIAYISVTFWNIQILTFTLRFFPVGCWLQQQGIILAAEPSICQDSVHGNMWSAPQAAKITPVLPRLWPFLLAGWLRPPIFKLHFTSDFVWGGVGLKVERLPFGWNTSYHFWLFVGCNIPQMFYFHEHSLPFLYKEHFNFCPGSYFKI